MSYKLTIYLILEYKKQDQNVWAEVQAFTSPIERDKAFSVLNDGTRDVETQDVVVTKREYRKVTAELPNG